MMTNEGKPNQRYVTEADVYNSKKKGMCQTLTLAMWPDGSGEAKVNDIELRHFIRFVDNTPRGRKRVIKMLRDAADLIERDVI
jgi:hypothetical protein